MTEYEQLMEVAVLAFKALEEIGLGKPNEELPFWLGKLDSFLANGLDEELWEDIHEAACDKVKEEKMTDDKKPRCPKCLCPHCPGANGEECTAYPDGPPPEDDRMPGDVYTFDDEPKRIGIDGMPIFTSYYSLWDSSGE